MGDDPDREAILTRRNRLVAVALSGMTTLAACADPTPCLSPPVPQPQQVTNGPTLPDETAPQPCLSVVVPPPPTDPAPRENTDSPDDEARGAEPRPADPAPMPCLSVEAPREDEPTR